MVESHTKIIFYKEVHILTNYLICWNPTWRYLSRILFEERFQIPERLATHFVYLLGYFLVKYLDCTLLNVLWIVQRKRTLAGKIYTLEYQEKKKTLLTQIKKSKTVRLLLVLYLFFLWLQQFTFGEKKSMSKKHCKENVNKHNFFYVQSCYWVTIEYFMPLTSQNFRIFGMLSEIYLQKKEWTVGFMK